MPESKEQQTDNGPRDRDSLLSEDAEMKDAEDQGGKDRPAALLVEPGKAPRLSSIDTKDLINFKEKYQHYIDLL